MRNTRIATALILAIAGLAAAGCDLLLTDPAPATPDLAIAFAFEESGGGIDAAFDRADRVYLRFTRADSAQRDTIVPLDNRDGLARARLVVEPNERINALGIYAELRSGQTPLFAGAKVVRVENGTSTQAEIPLSPIPATIRPDRAALVLQAVGDTAHLSAVVLFASGDTIDGLRGAWTSEDASIVAVSPTGVALARAVGSTRLTVTLGDLSQSLDARVVGGR